MRTVEIPVIITIPFPYDRPDKNGVIYSREAVSNAVNSMLKNLPVIVRDATQEQVVGVTDTPITIWDESNQICKVIIDGILFSGGAECVVNEVRDGIIQSFEITAIGMSAIAGDDTI